MRYGVRKLFRRGIDVGILPTYRCNLDCSYCSNKFGREGDKFDSTEISPDDWYRILSRFPVRIKELHITGGEPFLYVPIQELILKLLPLGFNISLVSNLLVWRDLSKVKSDRFRIEATLHNPKQEHIFYRNVKLFREFVRVDVDLFGETRVKRNKDGVATKMKMGEEDSYKCLDMKRFKITPDGRIWPNDREIGDTYSIRYKTKKEKE